MGGAGSRVRRRLPAAVLAAASLLCLWELHPRLVNPDGVGYIAYLPAVVEGSTLRTADVLASAGFRMPVPRGGTGLLADPFPCGAAALWTPAFWASGAAWRALYSSAPPALARKYAVNLASMLFGLLALWLAFDALRRAGERGGGWSCALALVGTPLFFYVFFDTSMAHATSAFTVTLFLWTWLETGIGDMSAGRQLLLGLLAGVMGTVRLQDAGYAVVLSADASAAWGKGRRRSLAPGALAFGAGFCLGFLPQAYLWKQFYGSWAANPQGAYLGGSYPKVLELLFSPYNGLLFWTPLTLAGVAGLAWGAADRGLPRGSAASEALGAASKGPRQRVYAGLLAAVVLQLVVMGLDPVWFQIRSFGLRRLTSAVLPAAFGLSLAVRRLKNPWARAAAGLAGAWSLSLALAAGRGLVDCETYLRPAELLSAQAESIRSLSPAGLWTLPLWWRDFSPRFGLLLLFAGAATLLPAWQVLRLVRTRRIRACAAVVAFCAAAAAAALVRCDKGPGPVPPGLSVVSRSGFEDFVRLSNDAQLYQYYRKLGEREREGYHLKRIAESPAQDPFSESLKKALLALQ